MRPRPLRVACVGHASLDHVFQVDRLPAQPVKTRATDYTAQGGGMGFNAAIAAARLGATVRMIGRVGDDDAAALLRLQLQREGVDARGLQTVPGCTTSVSAIAVDRQGQRQIFNHRGDALRRGPALDTRLLEGADIVLTDPRWPDGAAAALCWARQHGVLSMLDADIAPRADLRRLVPLAQWAVFSEPGWLAWGGSALPTGLQQARLRGPVAVVVTRGEQGCVLRHDGALHKVPAWRVKEVDTTAAGDVFHAALAIALLEDRALLPALHWASAAAAFKCERGPGVRGAPTRSQLLRWLRGRPETREG